MKDLNLPLAEVRLEINVSLVPLTPSLLLFSKGVRRRRREEGEG